ncbi:helix-turn-helix domain-containing protein [Streptomyces mobaraensis]|uniref:Helix-turn-helix transcriptional regulator n=1 Tax=Streptomyces mobaraensis TaxID=35621 RepID=A0A5N5W1Y7_STRMB|nr:helix-turn-helix transcriptional regulator [Streptomyces mobaraensis]KAB7835780.1 helix-turn-helix transcriptional regulator [Streptomyces mobaraensis]
MPAAKELDPLRSLSTLAGKMLRNRRRAAGLTQQQLADRIPLSQSMIAGIELGKQVPSAQTAQAIDDAVGAAGELAALWHHVRRGLQQRVLYPVWAHGYLEAEAEATRIQHFANLFPGVTQTEEYARAIFEAANPLFGGDIEEKVEDRMARKVILDRPDPVWFWSILDESALYRVVGSHQVMCAQLTHALELAERPRVTFRILPYDRGMPGGVVSIGAILLLSRPGKNEAVYWESGLNGALLETPSEVGVYRAFYDHLELEVLPPKASTELLRKAREEHHAHCTHH